MHSKAILFCLAISLAAPLARPAGPPDPPQSQTAPSTPTPNELYCSGVISTHSPHNAAELITGEGSNYKITFQEGDIVYINRGSNKGVKLGDEFLVVRRVHGIGDVPWFKSQESILSRIGDLWEDEGRVRIIFVHNKVSIGQVENSCNYLQRGDAAVPFAERPAPQFKADEKFDRFAPESKKKKAMVVRGRAFDQVFGAEDVIYVNLGSRQGVRVGDYFRIFRYQGTENETAFQTERMAFDVYGFGGVSVWYGWKSVPREVMGEGIVLRTGEHASTVLITRSIREIFTGDYVELE